ncbi:MAG: hypothetical protein MUF71_02365 [Candidatus Kapabacteria bacterium]|jgi:hypothetical protein|nr:hypothetical protein [Candidatus Kapabacteria bacterium]
MTNTKHILIIACITIFFLVSKYPAAAQMLDSAKVDSAKTDTSQKARENWYWGHGSYTYTAPGSDAFSIGLSAVIKDRLFTIHFKQIIPSYDLGMTSGFNLTEFAGMYGWINRNDWSFSSFSFGLAYCYNSTDFVTTKSGLGLVYEAQIALKAYVPGIGLKICGNINTVTTYVFGIGIVFYLGWMP